MIKGDVLFEELIIKNKNLEQTALALRVSTTEIIKAAETKGFLEWMYEAMSIIQISEKLETTYKEIVELFKKFGIPISREKRYARVRKNFELRTINKSRKQFNKKITKELSRKRCVRKRGPQSKVLKTSNMIRAIFRISRESKRTQAELKARAILKDLGLTKLVKEQEPIIVLNEELVVVGGYCVDFFIKRSGKRKHIIVLEIDSRHHHNLPKIIKKDMKEDHDLPFYNRYVLVRMWDDEITKENMERLLSEAKKIEIPCVIRFRYPRNQIKRPSKEFLLSEKEIETFIQCKENKDCF